MLVSVFTSWNSENKNIFCTSEASLRFTQQKKTPFDLFNTITLARTKTQLRIFEIVILKQNEKIANPAKPCAGKILRTRNCRRKFNKIYFLKNAKETCIPNNSDLNRD